MNSPKFKFGDIVKLKDALSHGMDEPCYMLILDSKYDTRVSKYYYAVKHLSGEFKGSIASLDETGWEGAWFELCRHVNDADLLFI